MDIATIFAVISAVSYGISNCIWKDLLKDFQPLPLLISRSILTTLFFAVLVFLSVFTSDSPELPRFLQMPGEISGSSILLALPVTFLSFFGFYFFVRALNHERVLIAVPVTYSHAIFGVLFSILTFRSFPDYRFFLAMTCFAVGIFLAGSISGFPYFRMSKGLIWSILAALVQGIAFSLFFLGIGENGSLVFCFIMEFTMAATASVMYVLLYKRPPLGLLTLNRRVLLLAISGLTGVVCSLLAISYSTSRGIKDFALAVPVVSILFACVWLRENLSGRKWAAVLLLLLSSIILRA